MAEADHDDTSSQCEWVSPREYVKRIARDLAAETEAEYSIAERFRRGKLRYCYRAGNGELHHDDLSDDFRREAVINFATATATRPGRTIREPNPDLPYVRGNLRPQPQWFGHPILQRDWDPFSRPDHIDREFPAETITELKFLVPRAPTVEPAAQKAPLPGRPSSASLVLKEAERRLRTGDIPAARKKFLQQLSNWLRDTHPKARPVADKTIGDHLRDNENVRALLPKPWLRRK
jgi:hypothetical protein